MFVSSNRKNKIDLSQYNYKKDIETRLLLSEFKSFDVKLLQEILFDSIQIPIFALEKKLCCSNERLISSLEKIQKTGLIQIKNNVIQVDKERRKYFETQAAKFDEDFEPNIDFIQNLLRLIPIQILPVWYSLPRTADNIFKSIAERIFSSTRLYERYLAELNFEDMILNNIMKDLFQSSSFQLDADDIRNRYQLNRNEFLECMLQLEYHFVCYLSYIPDDNGWKEVIVPFGEWHKFLLFKKNSRLTHVDNCTITVFDKKSLESKLKSFQYPKQLCSERNMREIERSLKTLLNQDWVYSEDFLSNSLICLDETVHLALKKQGRSWNYHIPNYSEEERAFIFASLYGRFTELGLIEIGQSDGQDCFHLSSYGKGYLLSHIS